MAAASHSYEAWAEHYIRTTSLDDKLAAPPEDLSWSHQHAGPAPDAPGRPALLQVADSSMRTPTKTALREASKRAQLAHTFWHHELQAAELMCWALLTFRDTPAAFRRGLIAICRDEIRHMRLYADYLNALGYGLGDFPVRDWFWLRVPRCASARSFAATMGVGLEGGNLDHTARFADRFRAVGDEEGAALQELVGREEIAHVRFALHWFRRWSGGEASGDGEARKESGEAVGGDGEVLGRDGETMAAADVVQGATLPGEPADFTVWRTQLPPPLSPILMRGRPLARKARREAGMSDAFIDALARWRVDDPRGI